MGDAVRAVGLFERACLQDEAVACDAAARMHARGEGVPEDDPRAVTLYVRACELGHGEACADIGPLMAVSETRGAEGRALLARGCEVGHPRSCTLAGIATQVGHGGPVDLVQAREFYRLGCEGGSAQGCGNLAVFLRDGLGGAVDIRGSVPLLERACEAGQTNSCVSLGAAHFRGDGDLEADPERARSIFEDACRAGARIACENLEVMAKGAGAEAAATATPRWTTTVGSLTIGTGDATATFTDVRSTCSPIPLSLAFGIAAGEIRDCLGAGVERRVSLVTEGGRLVRASVEPDDAAGRCVVTALGRAQLSDLTCALEATISR